MINNIKESFIKIVDKNEWMSDSVRAKAMEKILLMELRIGFPKELLDENLMDIWLKDVCVVHLIPNYICKLANKQNSSLNFLICKNYCVKGND